MPGGTMFKRKRACFMYRMAFNSFSRTIMVALMVCGILLVGASGPAWATSAQPQSTIPTITPGNSPNPQLSLGELRCAGQTVRVEFVVSQLPDNVTSFGSVSYVVNGQNRSASFTKRSGSVGYYSDTIPPPAQSANGAYDITSASVTITVNGGLTFSPALRNPNQFTLVCRTTGRSSTPTPTPAATAQDCSKLVNGALVGSNGEAQLFSGPWRLDLALINCQLPGHFEIKLLAPGAVPGLGGSSFFVGAQVEVTFFDANGQPVSQPPVVSAMRLCFAAAADDLTRAGGAANVALQTFDTASGQWTTLATGATNGVICAQLPHLSLFAVTARDQAAAPPVVVAPPASAPPVVAGSNGVVPSQLPNTGATNERLVPIWLWALIGLLLGGAGVSFALRRRRTSRAE